MSKVPSPIGYYKPAAPRSYTDGTITFIRVDRTAPLKKGETASYLFIAGPDGTKQYWSGLYPDYGSNSTYNAEHKGARYVVTLTDAGLTIVPRKVGI